MKKKIRVLLFMLISLFVLVGWGKKEVKLLDSSKLIDLNKAIELAKPGGTSGDSEEESDVVPEDEEESEDSTAGENYSDHEVIEQAARNIVIRIRGEKISYTCGSFNQDNISESQLEKRIRLDYSNGVQVTLMDDFAEAHKYKAVCDVLDKLNIDIGLTFKEDQYEGGK